MSTCPQVGSMLNEGIYNAQKEAWEARDIPRTREGDAAHYTAFLLGTPSLHAAGCGMQPIWHLPCLRCHVHFALDGDYGPSARGVF